MTYFFRGMAICGVLLALAGCIAIGYVSIKVAQIRQLDRAAAEVQLRDSEQRVRSVLGPPDRIREGGTLFKFCGEIGRKYAAGGKCARQYLYTIDTFYLPISWLIAFDRDGRAIYKHRLD